MTRQFGSTMGDYGNGVAIDSIGNVYVAGSTHGGLDGNVHSGGQDIFIIKYNANGEKQ